MVGEVWVRGWLVDMVTARRSKIEKWGGRPYHASPARQANLTGEVRHAGRSAEAVGLVRFVLSCSFLRRDIKYTQQTIIPPSIISHPFSETNSK